MSDEEDGPGWFSVRCFFTVGWPEEAIGKTYEERITLWRARSIDHAIELAEAEAREYAAIIDDSPSEYLEHAQAYRLDDEPWHGGEIFSLMRDSELAPQDYIERFFDTGAERQTTEEV
jgi:hypothetical protein